MTPISIATSGRGLAIMARYQVMKSSNKPTKCSNDVAAIISREVALPEWLFSYDYLYYIVKNILV